MNRRWLSAAIVTAVALAPLGATTSASAAPQDALQVKAISTLNTWARWLRQNNVRGYVGEVGWPRDDARWQTIAQAWYDESERLDLPVTTWVTGEWAGGHQLANFVRSAATNWQFTTSMSSDVMEANPGTARAPHGVNVTGPDMGAASIEPTSSFSNTNFGILDQTYHYDSPATMNYLSAHGMQVIRIPFRWERLQRTPFGALDVGELARLKAMVKAVRDAGMHVVLDMHNFAGYYISDGTQGVRRAIGSPELPIAAFTDVWTKIANSFAGAQPNGISFGLMNEPVNMPSSPTLSAARLWEQASQAALDAIRATGDRRRIAVGGYDWSGMKYWATHHPVAWINDPANNFMYEAHQYWNSNNSGVYLSYDDELAIAQTQLTPGAPTGVQAVAGDAQAGVSWTAPTSTGGVPITGYTVTASPGGITATTTGATRVRVTGLTNGVAYTFTVTASNDAMTGPASAPSSAVTPLGPPDAPTDVVAVAGNAQATVTWTAPDDGGSPLQGYRVVSSPGGFVATTTGATTATVTGLTNGTAYTFTVRTRNDVGASPVSAASNAVTPSAGAVPDAPTTVVATAGNGQADLTWVAPASDGGSPITSYTVTASPGGTTTAATGTSATVTGLTNGTTYTFIVVANNAIGVGPASSPSNPVTPLAPAPPGTMSVSPASVAVSEHTTLNFSYTAGSTMTDGSVTVDVPSGWTPPTSTPSTPGYTTATAGVVSVQGSTITVSGVNLAVGATMSIRYGYGGASSPVLPPSTPSVTSFSASERTTAGGSLTALPTPPSVLVTDGSQVSCADASITWTGAGDGTRWIDSANWAPARVPNSGDGVCIGASGSTVVVNGTSAVQWLSSAAGLDIQAPMTFLNMNRPSQLEGATSRWTSGYLSGRITVGPTATVRLYQGELSPTSRLDVDGRLLFSPEVFAHLMLDCDTAGNAASLVNYGRFEFSHQVDIAGRCESAVMTNAATGLLSAGWGGNVRLYIGIDNLGLVETLTGGAIGYNSGHAVNGRWRNSGSVTFTHGAFYFPTDTAQLFASPVLEGPHPFSVAGRGPATGNLHVPSGVEINSISDDYRVRTTLADGGVFTAAGGRVQAVVDGAGTLNITGGVIDADITSGGPRSVVNGTFVNNHSVHAGATLRVLQGGSYLAPGSSLAIDGTLSFVGSNLGHLFVDCDGGANAASIVNKGRIEFPGRGIVNARTCSSALLTNTATGVITNVGSGSGSLAIAVDNQGYIDPAIPIG